MGEAVESHVNDDPIFDIRCAVSEVLRDLDIPGDHKYVTDSVVDALPDFFRQALMSADTDRLIDDVTNLIDVGIRKSRYSTYDEWQSAVTELLHE